MLERKTVSQCPTSDYCKGWNDAVDAMPKWISVDERLPENNVPVLVWFLCGNGKYYHTVGSYSNRFHMWDTDIDENPCGYACERVTHWMKLPEPPKEDK